MGSFSAFHWLIVGIIVYALFRLFATKGVGDVMFCKNCGHHGDTVKRTPGSTAIELVLWICFIVPGLIYSLWRLSARKPACSKCGSTDLVPPDSPVAIAASKKFSG